MASKADELRALLDSQPKPDCAALTPFRIVEVDADANWTRIEFDEQPAFRNHFGNIQGGLAVGMIDVLVSVAAYAKTRMWLPTIEIKATFAEPIAIGRCVGEGRVLRVGKSVAFLEADLLTKDGRRGITATATALITGK